MFIDEVNLKLIAGKGGDGCTSFLREKYVPLGGPDGGNGGKGGNIIFKADKGLRTLIDLRYKKVLKGENIILDECYIDIENIGAEPVQPALFRGRRILSAAAQYFKDAGCAGGSQ